VLDFAINVIVYGKGKAGKKEGIGQKKNALLGASFYWWTKMILFALH
jgi:hypothetical protein